LGVPPGDLRPRYALGVAPGRSDPSGMFLAVRDSWGVWGPYAGADEPQPYLHALLSGLSASRFLRISSSPIPSGQP
jgi:hypothetical protein